MNKAPPQPSRQEIFSWIHSLLLDVTSTKVEELGKGVIYCRILNHYFPGVILINRIILTPKSEFQNMINLRILQNAFLQLKITIPLDPIKLSKEKLNDNWTFIISFYKYLTHNDDPNPNKPAMFNPYPTNSKYPTSDFMQGLMRQAPPIQRQPLQSIENVYNRGIQPFGRGIENLYGRSINNASKYSVGKLYKEPAMQTQGNNSPNKGKWSVNSHMFQNNLVPIIDRVKEILLKSSHDTQKIRQVKMLLNIPLNQAVVKVEDDDNNPIIKVSTGNAEKGNA